MRVGGKAKFVQLVGLGPMANATATSTWGPAPTQLLGAAVATGAKTVKAASAAVVLVDAPSLTVEQQSDIASKVIVLCVYMCVTGSTHVIVFILLPFGVTLFC